VGMGVGALRVRDEDADVDGAADEAADADDRALSTEEVHSD
jgi:hypothetical protein